MFGRGWEKAEATIVDRRLIDKHTEPDMGEFAGQGFEVYEYIADVRPQSGAAVFRATLKEPHIAITFSPPSVGQIVRVTFHAKDRKVKFDRSDPGTYQHVPGVPDFHRHGDPLKEADQQAVADAHSGEQQARWEAAASAAPGTATPTFAGPVPATAARVDGVPTDAEIKAASDAFRAASAKMNVATEAFYAAMKVGDRRKANSLKPAVAATNAEVQSANAEVQRLDRLRRDGSSGNLEPQ